MGSTSDNPAWFQIIYGLFVLAFVEVAANSRALAQPQAEVTFGAGEKVWLRLDKAISSKTAQVGDRVEAEFEIPRIAKGTRVIGTVVAARAANKTQRISAHLKLDFTQIVFADGTTIPMEGSFEVSGLGVGYPGSKTAPLVIGLIWTSTGAIIGALADGASGAAWGVAIGSTMWLPMAALIPKGRWKDVSIRPGRPFLVELKQDVHIPVARLSKP